MTIAEWWKEYNSLENSIKNISTGCWVAFSLSIFSIIIGFIINDLALTLWLGLSGMFGLLLGYSMFVGLSCMKQIKKLKEEIKLGE